jgi:hypothetical protein
MPPFSFLLHADDLPAPTLHRRVPRSRPLPTAAH